MPRSLPRSLASVVEALELSQQELVTMPELRALLGRDAVRTPAKVVAGRLRALGWLLDTGTRGVWEFAPAAHAGAISRGNPALPLAASLAAHRGLRAALALSSAAWAHGYANRVPVRMEVAVPRISAAPAALRRSARVVAFHPHLPTVKAKGVPTLAPASLLTHMVEDPGTVRSWPGALEWLVELAADLESSALAAELAGRAASTRVRAGYLLSGLRPDLAEPLLQGVSGPVRFGSRAEPVLRHSSTWRVIDCTLPSDPSTWPSALA